MRVELETLSNKNDNNVAQLADDNSLSLYVYTVNVHLGMMVTSVYYNKVVF